jgi:uncharacterized protein YraI
MTRNRLSLLLTSFLLFLSLPILVFALQPSGVTAEAFIEANLRATTDVGAELVGTIQSGTTYPVIGRSEFFPWLLLGDPVTSNAIGWVFQDLVQVNGNVNTVPFSTQVISLEPPPTQTLSQATTPTIIATDLPLVGVAVAALPTTTASANLPTPTATLPSGIIGTVSGEINIRFGPGVNYPRIGVARAGEAFEVTAYHTSVPWVQIRYDAVTGGFGWIAIDLLDIDGNIFTLPAVSRTDFAFPTLTPTPDAVQAVNLPGFESVALSPEFLALGEDLWDKVLQAGFEPETSRIGSLFLMDLRTGEALAFGDDTAYSGMSLTKILLMVAMFRNLDGLPDGEQARHLASMMVCSENTSSNQILSYVGGDPYTGALEVTSMLQQVGLEDSFIVAPFNNDPRITPQPFQAPTTPADQTRTNADLSNQITVSEMGYMLHGIYQCAADGTGPLTSTFGGAFTQNECQTMLYLMRGNKVGRFFEVGVPESVTVAHKHGWIEDTHGDAGIMFTPGGDYALVVTLHNPEWLNINLSAPLIEDIALTVYNHYNPDTPLLAPRVIDVPEVCDLSNADGARLMDNLMRGRVE